MRVYISGPITNCVDYKENFERAEKALREQGFEVIWEEQIGREDEIKADKKPRIFH